MSANTSEPRPQWARHQADDMSSHCWIGDVAPTHPPAIEDQTGHPLRIHGSPRGGDHGTERCAQQIHSPPTSCFHHGAQRFELQIHRWRARAMARKPTAGPVVANERPAEGQHLVVAALRWHRPAQLEVGQPPRDVDQWRTITRPGEGHVGTVAELDGLDRLLQRRDSARASRRQPSVRRVTADHGLVPHRGGVAVATRRDAVAAGT